MQIALTGLASSTADSAATQKWFNKLIEQKREEDKEKFGPATAEAIDLVTNFILEFVEGISIWS